MVNANRQVPFGGSFSTTSIIMLMAGLLILLGIVFQLGELGYGHINPANLWFVSVVTQSAWNLLGAAHEWAGSRGDPALVAARTRECRTRDSVCCNGDGIEIAGTIRELQWQLESPIREEAFSSES